MREADNANEVILKIERVTGIKVEAISGGKEAELLQRAFNRGFSITIRQLLDG